MGETTEKEWSADDRPALTPKGMAFLIAINTGLVVSVEGRYPMDMFGVFWDRVEREVLPLAAADIGYRGRCGKWQSSGSLRAPTARA